MSDVISPVFLLLFCRHGEAPRCAPKLYESGPARGRQQSVVVARNIFPGKVAAINFHPGTHLNKSRVSFFPILLRSRGW